MNLISFATCNTAGKSVALQLKVYHIRLYNTQLSQLKQAEINKYITIINVNNIHFR